jgi:GNAT superfamily N-acetyltransferase
MAGQEVARPGAISIVSLGGAALTDCLDDIAGLRIEVFRAWPYLYDGTLAYERRYLSEFGGAKDAIVVIARDGGAIVGAATAAPLTGHTPEFAALFAARGIDPERTFYCGESVLLPDYRGRGIGHAFFDRREAHARTCRGPLGPYEQIAFCGVVRARDDRRAPRDYTPLDAFWRKRGYSPVEGLVGSYGWKEIGAESETEKAMQFWIRAL